MPYVRVTLGKQPSVNISSIKPEVVDPWEQALGLFSTFRWPPANGRLPFMTNHTTYSLFALLLLAHACTPSETRPPTLSRMQAFEPADETAIRQVMADQEKAWDAGDIDGFMKGYADSLCYIGRKGLTCGKAEVTANYKKAYPDSASMGDLTFGVTELLPISGDDAWLTGTWKLVGKDTASGGFTLLWERKAEGWRIIRDHSY